MNTRLCRFSVLLVCLLVGAGLYAAPAGSEPAGAFCDPPDGLNVNSWVGPAAGDWDINEHWSLGRAPDNTDGATGFVCITAGVTVTMPDSVHVEVQGFDLGVGSTIVILQNSILLALGDPTEVTSVARPDSLIINERSTLGGTGRILLQGTLEWKALATGGATLSSVRLVEGAPAYDGPGGRLVVDDTGSIEIADRGVNLAHKYVIEVRGIVTISGDGYIAADHGTGFELRPHSEGDGAGELLIQNDGGYYQGRLDLPALSKFVNEGTIRKAGGHGTSVVTATYTNAGGSSVVEAGTLVLPDGTTEAVEVGSGLSYGSGACGPVTQEELYGCTPDTSSSDQQNAAFRVPPSDDDGARVRVVELGSAPAPAIGTAVRAHATGLQAGRRSPARVVLRYDSSLLNGYGAKKLDVARKGDGQGYRVLDDCGRGGRVPKGEVACVDRRTKAGSGTLVDCDVVMAVNTIRTSRWIARFRGKLNLPGPCRAS